MIEQEQTAICWKHRAKSPRKINVATIGSGIRHFSIPSASEKGSKVSVVEFVSGGILFCLFRAVQSESWRGFNNGRQFWQNGESGERCCWQPDRASCWTCHHSSFVFAQFQDRVRRQIQLCLRYSWIFVYVFSPVYFSYISNMYLVSNIREFLLTLRS